MSAGLDVEICPAQAEALGVAGIAEIDVFKADGAVLDFLDRVFRVLDVRHHQYQIAAHLGFKALCNPTGPIMESLYYLADPRARLLIDIAGPVQKAGNRRG